MAVRLIEVFLPANRLELARFGGRYRQSQKNSHYRCGRLAASSGGINLSDRYRGLIPIRLREKYAPVSQSEGNGMF